MIKIFVISLVFWLDIVLEILVNVLSTTPIGDLASTVISMDILVPVVVESLAAIIVSVSASIAVANCVSIINNIDISVPIAICDDSTDVAPSALLFNLFIRGYVGSLASIQSVPCELS